MWFAILITVLAAAGNNIGKVLQKQATRNLPRLVLNRQTVLLYLRSGLWVTGTLTDLGGALLMIVAFAYAPVSVVQPVSAVGLVILLIFSHFYLKERLQWHEWLSAAVAFCGVLGLGASAEATHAEHPAHLSAWRVLGAFSAMVAALVAECWWRHSTVAAATSAAKAHRDGGRPHAHHHHAHAHHHGHGHAHGGLPGVSGVGGVSASTDAVLCGLEAGACFGFSAVACRTGFILSAKLSVLCVPLGLAASVALTSSGFLLQTRGLKAGNTVVVCVAAAVSSMISGVAAGMVALDERLPSGHGMKLVRLASWVCILAGVTSLAGGLDVLAAGVAAVTPAWALRALPRPLAAVLTRHQQPPAGGAGGAGGGVGNGVGGPGHPSAVGVGVTTIAMGSAKRRGVQDEGSGDGGEIV